MANRRSPLDTMSQARREFRAWLDVFATAPDPARLRSEVLRRISQLLQEVDGALRSATLELTASPAWREEAAAYRDTLRDLRAKLDGIEIALRIRSNQLAGARARARAVGAWADLARHIG